MTFADSDWATDVDEYLEELATDFMVSRETIWSTGPKGLRASTEFTSTELVALLRRAYEAGQQSR